MSIHRLLRWIHLTFLMTIFGTITPFAVQASPYEMQVGTKGIESTWEVGWSGNWHAPYQGILPGAVPGAWGIGVTSGLKTGTPIPSIDLNNWDGVWVAKHDFYLPSWAKNPQLRINRAIVDDKALVVICQPQCESASVQVGFGGLFALNDKTGPGSFIWDQDVTFDLGIDFVPPDPLPLLAGALNEIWVIVNNTGSDDLNAPAQTFAFPGDYSYLSLDAVVTYMPEPPAWSLLAVAGLCVLVGLWRRPAGKRNLRGHALG